MSLSRIGAAALISMALACGGTSDDKPQPPADTSASGAAFTGTFGDSAKPDTAKPIATAGETGATGGNGSGRGSAGTTDTGTVRPTGAGTTDTSSAGAGSGGRPGTLDTASTTTPGRVNAHVFRPTAGVYDTAVAPPPAPSAPRRTTRGAIPLAGVHR